MTGIDVEKSPSFRAGAAQRAGLVSLAMLLSLAVCVAILALVIDLAAVSYTHEQLRTGCEAAALAGAAELMDENVLYPHRARWLLSREALGEDDGDEDGLRDDGDAGQAIDLECAVHTWGQVRRARRMAETFASLNRAGASAIELAPNPLNDTDGDTVAGWVDDPTDVDCPLSCWRGLGPCNTLSVQARLSDDRGNPLTLGFARLCGLDSISVMSQARATVDQRLYGFRPVGKTNIPLVPLAILCRGTDDSWIAQAFAVPLPGVNDKFTVDAENQTITLGPDGIPEITLRGPDFMAIHAEVSASRADCLSNCARQIEFGIDEMDLVNWGGAILVNDSFPGLPSVDEELARVVLATCGQPRIWPLATRTESESDEPGWRIMDFAAGCVVDGWCEDVGERGQCVLVLQAGLLRTCTALVQCGEPRNPWIGKLVLTR